MSVAAKLPDTTLENWQRVMDMNLKGTFLGMKCVIPAVRDSGSVINMSSVAATLGVLDRAAKGGIRGGTPGALTS